MNILCILGSPRKKGNSETLTNQVIAELEGRHTVTTLRLNPLDISPCQGCGGCNKSGTCVIDDDMTPLYQQVDEADRLLLATPVYFYNVSGQMKCFIDRFQARWARKYLLNQAHRPDEQRSLHLLATAATKGAKVFDAAILTARCLADTLDMDYGSELLIRGVEGPKAVADNPEILEQA